MRNGSLYTILREFTGDSALQLTNETLGGVEIPFEIVESDPGRPGRVPLYCYRPLTGSFIRERLGLLATLPSYAAASRALAEADGIERYLTLRGESHIPAAGRERADAALRCFLARVFEERSEFGLDDGRFEVAYEELEHAVYEGRCVTTVIVPLLGVALAPDATEVPLGDGLALVPGDALKDAPTEAVWGAGGVDARSQEPHVLLVLTATQERTARVPIAQARSRFRRVLTAMRLFERGGYALGPNVWTRSDEGAWRAIAFGSTGRPRFITLIAASQEDELRAFCNLIARRMPTGGEVAWALGRYEMGCERFAPFEALTDYLLALRALLEPEGPSSGRLAQRLAVICAQPPDRTALAERTAHAISLERAVVAGLAPAGPGVDKLVEELAEHLRALLRDVLCGHLDEDLRTVADDLLQTAAAGLR
ncbi:MAG TPA: hypothetical protein VG223_08760 [Solirubrobacteraceae bacterium]|nr:hypothetical protein [Solirubrobacteraceae bacterium]